MANSVRFSHDGTDMRAYLNKSGSSNTASIIFQSGDTGLAEVGLIGDDQLRLKMSADGQTWQDVFVADAALGQMDLGVDLATDRWVGSSTNTALGLGVFGANGLTTGAGLEGLYNCAFGSDALFSCTTGFGNSAFGFMSLRGNTSGDRNCATGYTALFNNHTGNRNTAVGFAGLYTNADGSNNTAVGYSALYLNQTGERNTAIGDLALYLNQSGNDNVAVGASALRYMQDGSPGDGINNCVGLGNGTRVSASNQVQLGNSQTTAYAYGAVQDRSDERDKCDVRNTVLGLDFVLSLRPVDYILDMRDDYVEFGEDGMKTGTTVRDGSHKRTRFHHGFLAQDIRQVGKKRGFLFGGFQDHSLQADGADVLTLGYTEFIAPMVRAIQQQNDLIEGLKQRIGVLEGLD